MILNSNEISKILPHKFPFLLVDKIIDCVPGRSACGIKCVTVNEGHFQGHFTEHHVMPGVLILEAFAQVSAIAMLKMPENSGKLGFFRSVNSAKFKKQVIPGDVLELKSEITKVVSGLVIAKCKGFVDGKVCATAEISFAIA